MHSLFPPLCQTTLHQIASHCYKYLSKHTADIGFWLVPRILQGERQVYLTGPRGEGSPMLLRFGEGHSRVSKAGGSHAAHILTWLITTATVDGITLLKTPPVCKSNWSWHNIPSCFALISKKCRNTEMKTKDWINIGFRFWWNSQEYYGSVFKV